MYEESMKKVFNGRSLISHTPGEVLIVVGRTPRGKKSSRQLSGNFPLSKFYFMPFIEKMNNSISVNVTCDVHFVCGSVTPALYTVWQSLTSFSRLIDCMLFTVFLRNISSINWRR